MNTTILRIRGIDPLLFRDGRPFSSEVGATSARTLQCPYPGTIAGFLRTFWGNRLGLDWNRDEHIERALQVAVHAPVLECNGKPVFHAPADAVVYRPEGEKAPKVMCLRPDTAIQRGEGCNLPDDLLPVRVSADIKPAQGYTLWDADALMRWLSSPNGSDFQAPDRLAGMESEERIHVAIADGMGTGEEGLLYTVQFLSFERYRWEKQPVAEQWSLLARVEADEAVNWQGAGLLGGEKRLAAIERAPDNAWLACPNELQSALASAQRVRMVLATPAIFSRGWRPGWLNDHLQGEPPGAPGLRLKLVSAAVRRREAVSGWDMRARPPQPKPTRLMAPAGSVYFFEVLNGDPSVLADTAWLQPVSDSEQHRRDGYGLALWAIW